MIIHQNNPPTFFAWRPRVWIRLRKDFESLSQDIQRDASAGGNRLRGHVYNTIRSCQHDELLHGDDSFPVPVQGTVIDRVKDLAVDGPGLCGRSEEHTS